jgi:hypothetical protein
MKWLHMLFGLFFSSQRPSQIGKTAENKDAVVPSPIFFLLKIIIISRITFCKKKGNISKFSGQLFQPNKEKQNKLSAIQMIRVQIF